MGHLSDLYYLRRRRLPDCNLQDQGGKIRPCATTQVLALTFIVGNIYLGIEVSAKVAEYHAATARMSCNCLAECDALAGLN